MHHGTRRDTASRIGYAFAWFVGVPLPVVILLYMVLR